MEPAALGPLSGQEGVAQRAQEVAEVVFVAEQARAGEKPRIGFLHEVLSVLTVAAESPGGTVEPVDVVSEPRGIEQTLRRENAHHRWCI